MLIHLGWSRITDAQLPRRMSSASEHLGAALNSGADVLTEWPGGLHALLNELAVRAPGRRGRFGIRRELGALAGWVNSLPRASPAGVLLRRGIAEWWGRRNGLTRSPDLPAPADITTLAGTAAALGVSQPSLRRAAAALRLELPSRHLGPGAPIPVETRRVEQAKALLDDLVGDREAAHLLGCGRKLLEGLAAAGALDAADARHLGFPGRRRWRKTGLQAWLDCVAVAGERSVADGSGRIRLDEAIVLLRRRAYTLGDICAFLITGCLDRPHPCDGIGLRGMTVSLASLMALRKARQDAPADYTIREAARRLNLKEEVVYHLCRRGLLASTAAERGRRVSEAALASFAADFFVPAKMEQPGDGKSRGWLALRLIQEGAVAVSGPSIDSGRQWIFRKADVVCILGRIRSST